VVNMVHGNGDAAAMGEMGVVDAARAAAAAEKQRFGQGSWRWVRRDRTTAPSSSTNLCARYAPIIKPSKRAYTVYCRITPEPVTIPPAPPFPASPRPG
jgi:hypothetical protein